MEISTYVGFDVSKSGIAATAVDPLGHRLRQEKLGASDEEIRRFLADLPRPTRVVLEACNEWEHVYDAAAPVIVPGGDSGVRGRRRPSAHQAPIAYCAREHLENRRIV
jgi:hypothetical protein